MNYEKLWNKHSATWRHCLRCPLSDDRVAEGMGLVPLGRTGELPLIIQPARWMILLSTPDTYQAETGDLRGTESEEGVCSSVSWNMVTLAWNDMLHELPFGLDEVAVSVALGCRPVNHQDPRRIMAPKPKHLLPCRPRWQTELLIADPHVVYLAGRHALAAASPRMATKWGSNLGEIVPFTVRTPKGPVEYCGFVGLNPEDVFRVCRDDHFQMSSEWLPAPASRVEEPYRAWVWSLILSSWVAEVCHRGGQGKPIPSQWTGIVNSLEAWFRSRTSVRDLVHSVAMILDAERDVPVRDRVPESDQDVEPPEVEEDDEDEEGEERDEYLRDE